MIRRTQNGIARTTNGIVRTTSVAVSSGLSHWYKLNSGSGSTATDYEGSSDLTINGASWTSTSKTGGQALDFDGTDDNARGSCTTIDTDGVSGEFSVVMWVRAESKPSSDPIYMGGWGSDNNNYLNLFITESGNDSYESFLQEGGTNNATDQNTNISTDTWTHLASTVTGSSHTFYIDGSEVANLSHTLDTTSISDGSQEAHIGERTGGSFHFDGQIDDFRLYNKALTSSEVSDIYNNTK